MNYRGPRRGVRQRGVYGTPQEATAEGAEEGDPDFNRWLKKKNGQISGGGGSNFSARPAKVGTGYGGRLTRRFS